MSLSLVNRESWYFDKITLSQSKSEREFWIERFENWLRRQNRPCEYKISYSSSNGHVTNEIIEYKPSNTSYEYKITRSETVPLLIRDHTKLFFNIDLPLDVSIKRVQVTAEHGELLVKAYNDFGRLNFYQSHLLPFGREIKMMKYEINGYKIHIEIELK
jgi:hypothetical protein